MKRFVVARNFIGSKDELTITEQSYNSAEAALTALSEIVLLEERFDSLTSNFLDFEQAMMAKLLEFNYVGIGDGMNHMDWRRLLNRLLTNTMSAAKGFVDHLPRTCNIVFGRQDDRGQKCMTDLRNSYDNTLGYRIFEALRNHSQHFGFPIHAVSYGTHMDGDFPKLQARHTISPLVDVEVLKLDPAFKKQTLKELEAIGKKIDLKSHLRDYVGELAKAHYRFRELAAPVLEKSGRLLDDLVDQYRAEFPEERADTGLYVVSIDDAQWVKQIPLLTGMRGYGEYLAKSNLHFDHAAVGGFLATAKGCA